MTLRISLDLYEMTYGQLIDFADAARTAGVDRQSEVTQVPVQNEDTMIDRFEIEVDNLPHPSRTLDSPSSLHYREVLQAIIDNDGDARNQLPELMELRDLLS
jgi:hypothetical protein